jgi:hypothetical protein
MPQHLRHRKVDIVHAAEDLVVQRVQADRDALEPCVLQRLRLAREQGTVGRQRDVQRQAFARAQGGQLAHQQVQVLAQQGLAAGQAQLVHAMRDEDARQSRDLLEAQQRGLRQEAVVLVEDLLGHAVAAAEVAAVGDRDAKVAQRTTEAVGQQADRWRRLLWNPRDGCGIAQVGQWNDGLAHVAALCRFGGGGLRAAAGSASRTGALALRPGARRRPGGAHRRSVWSSRVRACSLS